MFSDFMNIQPNMDFITCDHITSRVECSVSEEHDKFIVIVYNPIGRKVSNYIRLPVQSYNYQVYNDEGNNK